MLDFSQFVAGRSGELGVQSQYLDGELHFVDDSLSGAVPRIEQFEILDSIVSADSIDVMHGFFFEKRPFNMLGHNESMFHNRMFFAGYETWYSNPHIAVPFYVSAIFTAIKFVQSANALMFCFARHITIFLLFIKTSAWFASLRTLFATSKTNKCISGFTCFSTSYARTLSRAVHRISTIFFVVRGNKRFLHRKFLIAFQTAKFYDCLGVRNSFVKTVRASTRESTVFPVFTGKTGKRLLTVLTDFLNRHVGVPSFGDEGALALPFGKVK